MKDDIRKAIDDMEFNAKKCGEICVTITDMLEDNKCSGIEKSFIIAMLTEFSTANNTINTIRNMQESRDR